MLQVRTFHGHDMPLVEVRVDGLWYPGDLRAWRQHDDRSWTAQVSWTKAAGETYMDTFAAEDVRAMADAEERATARWTEVRNRSVALRSSAPDEAGGTS